MKKSLLCLYYILCQALLVLQANGSRIIEQQVNDSAQTGLYLKGPIVLCGRLPQQLYSSHSKVNNIVIDNSSKVILSGDLSIAVSLTIQKGIFDASKAALTIADTATISINSKAKFIKPIVQYTNSFPFSATVHSYHFDICFFSHSALGHNEPYLSKANVTVFVAENYLHRHNLDWFNPPKY
jgi:hypothetical protein